MKQINSNILVSLAEKWPSSLVARTQIEKFSGGLITEKYLANLDSLGKGPTGRIRCGRKVAYPVNNFIKWLEGRSILLPEHHQKDAKIIMDK